MLYFFWAGIIEFPISPVLLLLYLYLIVFFFLSVLLFFFSSTNPCPLSRKFQHFSFWCQEDDAEPVVDNRSSLARDCEAPLYSTTTYERSVVKNLVTIGIQLNFKGMKSTGFISLNTWVTSEESLHPLDGCRFERTCVGLIPLSLLTPLPKVWLWTAVSAIFYPWKHYRSKLLVTKPCYYCSETRNHLTAHFIRRSNIAWSLYYFQYLYD